MFQVDIVYSPGVLLLMDSSVNSQHGPCDRCGHYCMPLLIIVQETGVTNLQTRVFFRLPGQYRKGKGLLLCIVYTHGGHLINVFTTLCTRCLPCTKY